MDASKSDVDFDSYWDEEARNPNRNRIRIGRQYQAQCPLLLKTGESDGRNLEELETLTWNPNNALNSHQLNEYFAIAKSIGLFIQAIDTCQDGIDEIECLEEEKCSLKPFEILDNGTKCVLEAKPDRPVNNNSNNNVISSPEKQSVTTRQRLQQQQQSKQPNVPQKSEEIDAACPSQPSSSSSATPPTISPLKQCSNTRIQSFAKGLPAFILAHHTPSLSSSEEHDKLCQFASTTAEQPINLGSTEKYNTKTLAKLLLGQWNESEAKVFAQAIKECGKNFSAIKKDYLPWKSVRSIIEFYYLTLDKEKERKRKLRKTEAKTNKHSPENNKKKKGQQSGQRQQQDNNDADNSSGSTQNKNDDGNDNKDSNNATNNDDDDDDANDDDGNNSKQTDQPTPPPASSSPHDDEDKSEYCEQDSKDELLSSSKGIKNDNICLDLASTNNGNINGNNSYLLSPESKNSITPGQEVKPIKAKPILSQNETVENRSNIDSVNKTNLGSLNLYLNGELVLRLNAQQQESGQKWVESMDMPLRRKQLGTINNGFGSSRSAGIKRSFDSKSFKEDPDDVSLGGGDVSGSDDDSMTSNESSSLVASSPSSSSTITSAAKKVRVKVENSLNSLASVNGNNNPISSSPNSNGLKSDQSSPMFVNGSGCSKPSSIGQAPQPIFDNLLELDFKKKLLEYYQMNMGMNSEEMQLLLTSALLVDPPKAHSNSISSLVANHNSNLNAINNNNNNNNGISSFYSPVKETKLSKTDCLTPPKTISPASSLSSSPLSFMTNGYTNGFVSGPVDLTRKSPLLNHHHSNTGDTNNNHHSSVASSKNQSPSRHKLSSSSSSSSSPSSSSFSLPRAAHESSRVSPSSHHHHHRRSSSSSLAAVVGNNSSPFSLPAPPPMLSQSNNVPMSLSNNNKSSFATLNNNIHSRKSLSSIRGSSTSSSTHQESGIHQYAKL